MKFDDFYALINDWGRYQRGKYLLICLSYMLPSIMVYTYSFTAAKPKFRCENPQFNGSDQFNEYFNRIFANDYLPDAALCSSSQGRISIEECQRCFRRKSSLTNSNRSTDLIEECETFVYDRTFYLDTLTEKVKWTRETMSEIEISFFRWCWIQVEYGLPSCDLPINDPNHILPWLHVWINRFWNSCWQVHAPFMTPLKWRSFSVDLDMGVVQ